MSKVISIRVGDAEYQAFAKLAAEKQQKTTELAKHIFLQQVALTQIVESVSQVVQAELIDFRAEVAAGQEILAQQIAELQAVMPLKEDLIKATNFIVSQVKK